MQELIRVLIVDSDTDLLSATIHILKSVHYDVLEARNGAEAIIKVKAERPDLILMNMVLPDIGGTEVCKQIKGDSGLSGLHVILMCSRKRKTGYWTDHLESGADGYIIRPIDKWAFLARIASAARVIIAERKLKESEELFRRCQEEAPDGIYINDLEGNFLYGNRKCEEISGYKREELIGNNFLKLNILTENSLARAAELLQANIAGQSTGPDELELIRKDGSHVPIEINTNVMLREGKKVVLAFVRDITDRKRVEEALRESEEKHRRILDNAQVGIYQSTPEGQFITANQSMATMLGYDSSAELIATIKDMTHQVYVNPEDRFQVLQLLQDHGTLRGFEVQYKRKDGSRFWVSLNVRSIFDSQCMLMCHEGICEDITDRKESIDRLRKALGATVRAIAAVVETRDPYTAGHQKKVADLARTIAQEMGLSDDRVDGLRMAAVIHDIGKISVPSEILSKPSKLTDIEFSLIRIHPQSAYDILKDVEFPWPIARMVLEHHERMNGSGYPNALKGKKLLLESRIMAVADVVESMASHRPYRPAIGIEAALDEIKKNRGILYDSNVVDACLRIFNEKGYKMAG